jgi:hypothetical protein
MKILGIIEVVVIFLFTINACNRAGASYIDLDTGEPVMLVKDSLTGRMVNVETGKPVRLYVDKKTRDTIYGPTGEVVNYKLRKTEDGKYVYAGEFKREGDNWKEKFEDGDYKLKSGDHKKKTNDEGDIKVKDGEGGWRNRGSESEIAYALMHKFDN